MWAARTVCSEGMLSLWWFRATTAMLETLIYTWISQYRSTGVKCAFLYIFLIVFSLSYICCFKAPATATGGVLRHDNGCIWVCLSSTVLCVYVCGCVWGRVWGISTETHWMDALKGKACYQTPWMILLAETQLYCTALGIVRKQQPHSQRMWQCVDLNQSHNPWRDSLL